MSITKIIAATALIAAAGSALAEQPFPPDQPFVSTKTRAEVIAEIKEAGSNLGRDNYAATFNPVQAHANGKTRAEVLAELKEANGDLGRSNYLNTTH